MTLTLNAPLNLDTAVRETGYVFVTNPLTGSAPRSRWRARYGQRLFEGTYVLPNAPYVTVSYGSGIFLQSADVTVSDYVGRSRRRDYAERARADARRGRDGPAEPPPFCRRTPPTSV